jgi:hypothetical protein
MRSLFVRATRGLGAYIAARRAWKKVYGRNTLAARQRRFFHGRKYPAPRGYKLIKS